MKYCTLALTILLVGCSTTPTPITAKFPAVPHELLEKCPQLKTVDMADPSIIALSKTVVENYTTYYTCSNKNDSWIEWYTSQKQLIEK